MRIALYKGPESRAPSCLHFRLHPSSHAHVSGTGFCLAPNQVPSMTCVLLDSAGDRWGKEVKMVEPNVGWHIYL